jgi:hypothetical protein
MKKQLNKLTNKRLRSSLSIMVLSLCTVFLFLSNSAQAQTTPEVTGDGSNGTNIVVTNVPTTISGNTVSTETVTITKDADGYYEISDYKQLRALSCYVNAGFNAGDPEGENYMKFKLMNDIDMSNPNLLVYLPSTYSQFSAASNFIPIGGCNNMGEYVGNVFGGLFNGNGHIIKGLKMCFADGIGGLFGLSYVLIENVGVVDSYFSGCDVVGSICAENRARIYCCYARGNTIIGGNGTPILGGICGNSGYDEGEGPDIQYCYAQTNLHNLVGRNQVITYTNEFVTPNVTYPTVQHCYYDNGTTTDGTEVEGYGTGLSTATMKSTIAALNTTNHHIDGIYRYNGYGSFDGLKDYKADYSTFVINDGYPVFNTQTNDPYTIYDGKEVVIPEGNTETIPSAITIKDGGSLIIESTDENIYNTIEQETTVETQMKVGAWNLFGRVLDVGDIGILNNNQGLGYTENHQHDMAAVKYDDESNLWNTTTYLYKTDPCELVAGYFVYPYVGAIGNNQVSLNDDYVIVSQQGTSTNPLMHNYTPGKVITVTTARDNWVALSNPFYGKVKVSDILDMNSTTIDGDAVYVYDPDKKVWKTNLSTNNIYTWNASTNSYDITTGTAITTIKPAQGFMVVAADASGYRTEFTFSIGQPTTSSSKAVTTHNNLMTFASIANNTVKEAFANVNEQASNEFDNNDAFVMLSTNNEDLVEPYFVVNDKQILKDEFKTMPYVAPINFHASKVSNTDLTVSNIPNNVNVSIVDLSNGNETALTNGSAFHFTANEGENSGRFVVKFAKNNVGIDNNAQEDNVSLAMYPNPTTSQTTLFVDGLTNDAQVSICDVQGRTINTYTMNKNQSTLKINTESLASGVYYIRVVTNNLTKTEKLVVK